MSTRVIQEKRPKIERIKHTNLGLGRPYYDHELKMSQSEEHKIIISYLYYCFRYIAKSLKLGCLSDNPVWYLLSKPRKGKTQKVFYPDLCVSKNLQNDKAIASDLLFSLEVVSTERRRKEIKDTVYMKGLNQYNKVPEFVLVYPKASDNRVIEYYTYDGLKYQPLLAQGGEYHSNVIEGLSIREIPRDDWKDGEKVEVLFKGKLLVNYEELWEMIEEEQKRTEKEVLEKEKLARKLRELGFNPNEIVES